MNSSAAANSQALIISSLDASDLAYEILFLTVSSKVLRPDLLKKYFFLVNSKKFF